ncbi:hypothetical protein [Yimella sp. cx-51]|uniref:AMIN-like domain-containing (lipo)protein n=1 Tax=Yimella sp. cx-51 TaxID=2770551 RepID=UPI00165DEEC5|nr:hypothetical protein [Yimella sp. cx-51]MBC9958283.1 hypothetical protein [Yimella sp. cx-51]QTH38693.1 hypothetical protein J5M86_03340 [Yimella sp. cx-51]
MKRTLAVLASATTTLAVLTIAPITTDAAHATACTAPWGSLPKTSAPMTTRTVNAVRVGQHGCFERMVIDLGRGSGSTGYDVRYVSQAVVDPTGQVLRLRGNAVLQVIAKAPAYTNTGWPTYRPANRMEVANVAGYFNFKQIAYGASFEGQTQFFIGMRGRLPMQAFVLNNADGGQRLVVDVVNSW